jgi:hypothetical protein
MMFWCMLRRGFQVDISTMLEEAVHYIKFMQLQIKVWFLQNSNRVLFFYLEDYYSLHS